MLSNVATINMETKFQRTYYGKNLTTGTGSIPNNTFRPSSSMTYNYFYMHYLNSTHNRITATWQRSGNYKIVFDLVEMTGGSDLALTWTSGKKVGGKNAQGTGLLLATTTLTYNIGEAGGAPIAEEEDDLSTVAEYGNSLDIYPNPTQGRVMVGIGLSSEELAGAVLTLSDVNGKVLSRIQGATLESNRLELDLTGWSQGVYFVSLRSGSSVITKKLVITK